MAIATRQRILDAALTCFLEDGFEQATVARVRERSGVSNGALFHHFASKEAIADAIYVQAIASFQSGLWEMLRRRPRSLRAAVRGTIAHQLSWVELNGDLARFVYLRGHLDWESQGAAEVSALNAGLSGAFREWMAPLVERGELRVSSMLLISAIVNGPAHALARRWLAGQLEKPLTAYVEPLADAAWAALRGEPLSVPPPSPVSTRITVELLDDDGAVSARAEHRVKLAPIPAATSTRAPRKEGR
ncbi:MAG: TetR family transcriptional regulator [Solirubrobacteraceae bacterium]